MIGSSASGVWTPPVGALLIYNVHAQAWAYVDIWVKWKMIKFQYFELIELNPIQIKKHGFKKAPFNTFNS